jgi:hypothetical protein
MGWTQLSKPKMAILRDSSSGHTVTCRAPGLHLSRAARGDPVGAIIGLMEIARQGPWLAWIWVRSLWEGFPRSVGPGLLEEPEGARNGHLVGMLTAWGCRAHNYVKLVKMVRLGVIHVLSEQLLNTYSKVRFLRFTSARECGKNETGSLHGKF